MPNIIKPNHLSFSSIFIEPMFGETRLGIATGFIWEYENVNYLVTNWHVMTGFHPETKQSISENGSTPDILRIWLHTVERLGKWKTYDVGLFDNQGRPRWKEHNIFREGVDVAIILLDLPDKFKAFPVNSIAFHDDFKVEISQDVFIVGFPRGITGAGKSQFGKGEALLLNPMLI